MSQWVKGDDLVVGDRILTGHPWSGEVRATGFRPDAIDVDDPTEDWFHVIGTTDGELYPVEYPYRRGEDVLIEDRAVLDDHAALLAFRELVRGIVHARPGDDDADILALLEKDHAHRADDQGCIYCS